MLRERRNVTDKRRIPTRPLSRYSFKGQRKIARRAEEGKNYYVDKYESRYFILISVILILCVLDAYFTLRILEVGGNELNPLMLILIDKKPILAMIMKYLITAISLIVILVHKNFILFGKVKVSCFIYVVFFIYFILVAYETYFFFTHIGTHKFSL